MLQRGGWQCGFNGSHYRLSLAVCGTPVHLDAEMLSVLNLTTMFEWWSLKHSRRMFVVLCRW